MPNATPGSVVAFADAPAAVAPVRGRRPQPRGRGGTMLAAVTLTGIALAALLAPWLAPYDPTALGDIAGGAGPPSAAHWLGTDQLSRDLLARLLSGARLSLGISLVAVGVAMVVGTAWGAVAGFAGGWVDDLLMRVVDAGLAIPRIILLLAVASFWGTMNPWMLATVLGLTGWFATSRLVRAEVIGARQRDFTRAAVALGASPARVLVRHVLPHALSPVIVAATLAMGQVVVVESGLSFLGYGVAPPAASWGSIIADGRNVMATAWWMSVFPGVALAATVLSINVLGDRLRTALGARQLPAS